MANVVERVGTLVESAETPRLHREQYNVPQHFPPVLPSETLRREQQGFQVEVLAKLGINAAEPAKCSPSQSGMCRTVQQKMLLRLRNTTMRAQPGIEFGATFTATVHEAQLSNITITPAPSLQVVTVVKLNMLREKALRMTSSQGSEHAQLMSRQHLKLLLRSQASTAYKIPREEVSGQQVVALCPLFLVDIEAPLAELTTHCSFDCAVSGAEVPP